MALRPWDILRRQSLQVESVAGALGSVLNVEAVLFGLPARQAGGPQFPSTPLVRKGKPKGHHKAMRVEMEKENHGSTLSK